MHSGNPHPSSCLSGDRHHHAGGVGNFRLCSGMYRRFVRLSIRNEFENFVCRSCNLPVRWKLDRSLRSRSSIGDLSDSFRWLRGLPHPLESCETFGETREFLRCICLGSSSGRITCDKFPRGRNRIFQTVKINLDFDI